MSTSTSASAYAKLARTYDLQHNLFTPDIPMYTRLAKEWARDRGVLEIGAGTGRVMIPLVQAGFGVTGVDNSPEMLAIAQVRLAASVQSVSALAKAVLVEADGRALDLGGQRFGMAFVALNTFLHNLTQADQLATLRAAAKHLLPDGALIIDLPPNDELANQPDDGEFELEATLIDPSVPSRIDKYVASSVFWASQEQELSYRLDEGGDSETVTFRLRHVFKHEMELLLNLAGFAPPRWYGDYDLSPYLDDSPRMICAASPA